MVRREPKFMRDLHKIRERISKECKNKKPDQIIRLIRQVAVKADLN